MSRYTSGEEDSISGAKTRILIGWKALVRYHCKLWQRNSCFSTSICPGSAPSTDGSPHDNSVQESNEENGPSKSSISMLRRMIQIHAARGSYSFRAVCMLAVLLLPAPLLAQFGDRSTQTQGQGTKSPMQTGLQDAGSLKKDGLSAVPVAPMDGPIDPKTYVVGPNDIFTVGIWGALMLQLQLVVSPEGSLIIPSVGEVPVAGKPLTEVKNEVQRRVRSRYTMGEITVTLTAPRTFIVSLRGSVIAPGTYTATAVDRVERVFRLGALLTIPTATMSLPAQTLLDPQPGDEVKTPKLEQRLQLYDKASTRNILLLRRTRDTVRVDLAMYEATNDDSYNPPLRDGDVIFVPALDIERDYLSIQGAVNAPGKYEFSSGDKLSSLIRIARGVTPSASGYVSVSRLADDGRVSSEGRYELAAVLNGGADDRVLERGDRVLVERRSDLRRDYSASIQGAVQFPGTYPISARNTTLSELLRSAGGLTADALPQGAIVLRKVQRLGNGISSRYEVARSWRAAQFNMVDSAYYVQLLREGRVPVRADVAQIAAGEKASDIILEDGDLISVPTDRRSVLVDGQVARPGYQPWVPGAKLEHYIEAAGGMTEMAEDSDTRVIKRGTLAWVESDETEIESGDQIWVPKNIPYDVSYYFGLVRDISTFLTAAATVGILVFQVTNN